MIEGLAMRSDAKRDKILDRVKKLLALSTSSNVNEAANAAAAAQRLMLEHRLTEADVSDTQEGQMFELSMGAVGFASRWKFVLVTAVARSFFCEAVGLRVGHRRKVRIVGRKEDVEIAARVFRYLHFEINRLAKIEIEAIDWGVRDVLFGSLGLESEQDPEKYLESFRRGAVAAVIAKFRSGEEDFVASDSRSLVISRRDRDRVREYVGAKFTNTRSPGREDVDQVDDLAFVRGYEQAQAIVLPGDGRTSTACSNPRTVPGKKSPKSPPENPVSGSPAEIFVKPEVRPAVDVVVTHAGSVPLASVDQSSSSGDEEETGKTRGHEEESQNVESFFNRLKNWWVSKN
jgi:Protein of unknown function (DUF2786)